MTTERLDALADREYAVSRAGLLLRSGELVAIPTETVYGLAARISNDAALNEIFRVKQRPADNPLIVHVSEKRDVEAIAYIDAISQRLIDVFWPGALTLVLPKKAGVSDLITASLSTVAVRMPSLTITRELIHAAGEPLAAPSANISGRPSATTARHVLDDFSGAIAAVVDAGPCEQGIESTVVRVLDGRISVLRPGTISRAQIEASIEMPVDMVGAEDRSSIASPGMHHRHYAPKARVVLCDSLEKIHVEIEQGARNGAAKGVVVLAQQKPDLDAAWRPLEPATLFAELRRADDLHLDKILVHCTEAVLLDEALMNRLRKAAEPFGESGVDK